MAGFLLFKINLILSKLLKLTPSIARLFFCHEFHELARIMKVND